MNTIKKFLKKVARVAVAFAVATAIVFSCPNCEAQGTSFPGTAPNMAGLGATTGTISSTALLALTNFTPYGYAWTNGLMYGTQSNLNSVFPLANNGKGFTLIIPYWATNTAANAVDYFAGGIDFSEDLITWTTNSRAIGLYGQAAVTFAVTNTATTVSNKLSVAQIYVPSTTVENWKYGRLTYLTNASTTNTFFFGTPLNANGTNNWNGNGMTAVHWN